MGTIQSVRDNLITMQVDAIVNSANVGLIAGSGLCGQIHDAAGSQIDIECKKLGGCERGEAKLTKGYNLPAKYVIHTVGPVYGMHSGKEPEMLYSCYYESMRLADNSDIVSIAFPYISSGVYGYPFEEVRTIAKQSLSDFLDDFPETSIKEVFLVEYSNTH